MTTAAVRTVDHGSTMRPDPITGSIPPYTVSEWAKDKTPEEILEQIQLRRRDKRLAGQFLDWSDLTLEMLLSEKQMRARRTPLELLSEPTDAEAARIAKAEQVRQLVQMELRNSVQLLREKRRGLTAASQAAMDEARAIARQEGIEWTASTAIELEREWELNPSEAPAGFQKYLAELGELEAAVESGDERVSKALVFENNTKANIMARAHGRRASAQLDLNEAYTLDNVQRSGGSVPQAKRELVEIRKRSGFRQTAIGRLLGRVRSEAR
jgi:hypothetical protein